MSNNPAKSIINEGKTEIPEGISVNNAGTVLLGSFFKLLFQRANLVDFKTFVSAEAQLKAVHHLNYVVTGTTAVQEGMAPLFKVLCGLPISSTILPEIEMTEADLNNINSFIDAMIRNWPAIGNSSVNGFRNNWLVRDGLLVEHPEKWELNVQKRPYDVLILRSQFANPRYTFSIIKYPWMDKPLYVNWNY